jgi:hypothetical protein
MRLRLRLARIPDGSLPLTGQLAVMRRISDATQIAQAISDGDGYVDFTLDGHPEPYYIALEGVPGGDRYWVSTEAKTTGAHSLKELTVGLRAGGDGVVRGVLGQLECSLSGARVTISPGAASIAGHPFVRYAPQNFDFDRPGSGIRVDYIVATVVPEGSSLSTVGASQLTKRVGDGTNPGALLHTADAWDLPLAKVTVPAGGGALLCEDVRVFPQDLTPIFGQETTAQSVTLSSPGVIVGAGVNLVLKRDTIYDIEARLTAQQTGVAPVWAGAGDFWSYSNNPLSFCQTPSGGWIYVGDYQNARVLRFDNAGNYYNALGGLTYVRGLAADDNYLYVGYYNSNYVGATVGITAHDLSLAITGGAFIGSGVPYAVTCTPTYPPTGWCSTSANEIWSFTVSPYFARSAKLAGFTDPEGMEYSRYDGYLYLVTRSLKAVYKYTTGFGYLTSWSGYTDPLGLNFDTAGNILVADLGAGLVRRHTPAGAPIDNFPSAGAIDVLCVAGDIISVLDYSTPWVHRYDQTTGGYGEGALEYLDATKDIVGDWNGPGNRVGAVSGAERFISQGPGTVTVRARHRATFGQAVLNNVQVSATAVPRS